MTDYTNSAIYKIHCRDESVSDFYLGSTSDFNARRRKHKSQCDNENDRHFTTPLYKFIRENGGWSNWKMSVIEQYECNTKREKEERERYWIEKLKPPLNYSVPTKSKKETDRDYYEKNKEKITQYKKEWHEKNKERIHKQSKEFREANKDRLLAQKKEYYKNNREELNRKNKERHEKNKEEINKKRREERNNNKEELNKKMREKVKCDLCDKEMALSSIWRHKRSMHKD